MFSLLAILNLGFNMGENSWQKFGRGIPEPEITAIALTPNQSTIFTGTTKAIYKSQDSGKTFRSTFQKTSGFRVNHLHINPNNPNQIFAATDSGIWESTDSGERWQAIFHPQEEKAKKCFSVLAVGQTVYVASLDGLYIREGSSVSWRKYEKLSGSEPVYLLESDRLFIYLATDQKVFRIHKPDQSLQEIFSLVGKESGVILESSADATGISISVTQIKDMLYSPVDDTVYLATVKGIYVSKDQGESWENLPSHGLPVDQITSLQVSPGGKLIVATSRGVFYAQEDGRYEHLYKGMETNQVRQIRTDEKGHLYAATDRGLFFLPTEKPVVEQMDVCSGAIQGTFEHEPTIAEVQAMAIAYADVHPRKIDSWRRRANHKAILPNLSVGLDRSASEVYHWDTGSNPDSLLKGKDFLGWDVSVSWNLGELIWNNDQTSIDSRSKLLVELREDILDQVTRLYFERRRLQVELSKNSLENEVGRFDQEMRLAELTALIDGLTGGEFGKEIRP